MNAEENVSEIGTFWRVTKESFVSLYLLPISIQRAWYQPIYIYRKSYSTMYLFMSLIQFIALFLATNICGNFAHMACKKRSLVIRCSYKFDHSQIESVVADKSWNIFISVFFFKNAIFWYIHIVYVIEDYSLINYIQLIFVVFCMPLEALQEEVLIRTRA